jgi:putative acetyltransferase
MPDSLTIAPADARSDEALRIIQRMYDELNLLYHNDPDGSFRPLPFDEPGGVFLMARDNGAGIACAGIIPYDAETGEVKRVYVDPKYRGKGLSAALMAALEAYYHRLRLETGDLQPAAIRLYEKIGYERIPCYGHYADNDDSVCFEKPLSSSL